MSRYQQFQEENSVRNNRISPGNMEKNYSMRTQNSPEREINIREGAYSGRPLDKSRNIQIQEENFVKPFHDPGSNSSIHNLRNSNKLFPVWNRGENNEIEGSNHFQSVHHSLKQYFDPDNYHDEAIPPDWTLAKIHGLARRVGPEIPTNVGDTSEVCPCCGYQVEREIVSITTSSKKLNFLGAAFPLYFNYVVFAIILLGLLFAISGLYNLITNANGNYCLDFGKIKSGSRILSYQHGLAHSTLEKNKISSLNLQTIQATNQVAGIQKIVQTTLVITPPPAEANKPSSSSSAESAKPSTTGITDQSKPVSNNNNDPSKPLISSTGSNSPAVVSENKPVGGTDNKPVAGTDNKPVAGTDNKPVAGTDNKPVAGTDNKPVISTENKPVVSTENKPSGSTNNKPGGNNVNNPANTENKPEVGSKPTGSTENKTAVTVKEPEFMCQRNWVSLLSAANKLDSSTLVHIQDVLNLIVFILIAILIFGLRIFQKKMHKEIDVSQQTAADYSIIVKNIPVGLGIDYEKELNTLFYSKAIPHQRIQVRKVNLVYKTDNLSRAKAEMDAIITQKKQFLGRTGISQIDMERKNLDENFKKVKDKIEIVKRLTAEDAAMFSGTAFITFNTEKEKRLILQLYDNSKLKKLFNMFRTSSKGSIQEGYSPGIGVCFRGNVLSIAEAPEPTDIDWDNIFIPDDEKLGAKFVSYALTFILYFVVFLLVLLLSFIQQVSVESYLKGSTNKESGASAAYSLGVFFSILIATFIVLVNLFVLGFFLEKIVRLEKQPTRTSFNIAFAEKYAVGVFINSSLIIFIIEIYITGKNYGLGGLLFTQFFVIFFHFLIPLLLWIADPWFYLNKQRRNKELAKGNQSTLTQIEANRVMELPTYIIAEKYGYVVGTLWVIFFTATILPMGVLLALIGLIIYYWVDKFNLLKRRCVRESVDWDLSLEMIEQTEWILPIFCLGNFFISLYLLKTFLVAAIICMVLGIIYLFLPLQNISEQIFKIQDQDEALTYDEVAKDLDTEYDRQNPITKHIAMKEWAENRSKVKGTPYSNNSVKGLRHIFF